MLKDLVKIANKLDSLGLTKIADEIDGMIKKAVDAVDSGDMGGIMSPKDELKAEIKKSFISMFNANISTLGKIPSEEKVALVREAFGQSISSSFLPRKFFEQKILPAYENVKAFSAPNMGVDRAREVSFSDVETYLMQISFAMKEYQNATSSSSEQISDSILPEYTPKSPSPGTNASSPQTSSSAAKTWEQYVAKTGKFGPQVQQAWMVYCATRRLPETYDAFVSWWKTQKAAGKFVNGGSPEETFMMLSSLTRNS